MNPPIAQQFRHAMRRQASTVSVVTCVEGAAWHGMTATSVTSVCTDPATLLVCINHGASMYQSLLAGRRFCVNLLSADQREVAQAFAGVLKGQERFGVGAWDATSTQGLPALCGAQASIFCTVAHILNHGTHSIVLGSVEAIVTAEQDEPLIYHNGHYAGTAPLRCETACAG